MKIIKEIEKSRLNDEKSRSIVGGAGNNPGECTDEILHRTCGSVGEILYDISPCAVKITCPSAYLVCGSTEKFTCDSNYTNP